MRKLIDFKSQDDVTIRRLNPTDDYGQTKGDPATHKIGIVLDVETTGVDHERDEIIEICMIPFKFDQFGRLGEVFPAVVQLRQPLAPITPEIVRITGITDEDVRGKSIDFGMIAKMLSRASIVIAHHASFDWNFVMAALAKNGHEIVTTPWLCTIEDVKWSDNDVGAAKLDYLAYRFGFHFNAHRAESDCRALIEILASTMPDDRTVLAHAFDGLRPAIKVIARNSLFDAKDTLKSRGYRWNPKIKSWWKMIRQEDVDLERDWLGKNAYNGWCEADFVPVEIWKRFLGR
jgi:DNA polymerase-3 subunit epsilon